MENNNPLNDALAKRTTPAKAAPKSTAPPPMPTLKSFDSISDARKAAYTLVPGTRILINGVLSEIVAPGRTRPKGSPNAIQFLETPHENMVP